MRSLKISGLLVLMLAALAACSNTFGAGPSLDPQSHATQSHLSPDDSYHGRGW